MQYLLILFLSGIALIQAQDSLDPYSGPDFKSLVRKSQPLSVEESLKAFKVPNGFKMELVASSPDIGQPMNLAFDERGRLWVSSTLEYPYPVPLGQKGRDTIKVFEDTTGDGRYDKITTFAEGLNIPTGIYPYKNGVIAWSIPNIWYFEDLDDDGKADNRTKIFGPLGYERDTHGMHSSFTMGFDGWLHITHGFNNNTTVTAKDGSSIKMNSGNTYRVRLDGSSVEQFTFGQVNPFGMCLDEYGNFYTADCHSSPIYQLISNAYYPSFGKPHDGIGFAPLVIRHNHDSTGLCGIVFNQSNHWPKEFQDNIFVGNVVTSRVNRDKVNWFGSSPKGVEMPDLIRTRDPWFRPVDLQFGPDGALYIADFYNRIIGHYEVRLDHPSRDREKGRIWRLTYNERSSKSLSKPVSLPDSELAVVIDELASPLLSRRMLAAEFLVDDIGVSVSKPLKQAIKNNKASSELKAHGAWVLHRLAKLDQSTLLHFANDSSPLVRSHMQRIAGAQGNWNSRLSEMVLDGLSDDSPYVVRASADALSRWPHAHNIRPLLNALKIADDKDEHLRHALSIALRNNLRLANRAADFEDIKTDKIALSHLLKVALAVDTVFSSELLLANLDTLEIEENQLTKNLRHIARNTPKEGLDRLARIVQKRYKDDIDFQAELLLAINDGILQRGLAVDTVLQNWAKRLVLQLLDSTESVKIYWRSEQMKGTPISELPWAIITRNVLSQSSKWKNHVHHEYPTRMPWVSQARNSLDGKKNESYISSLSSGGESLTGILRSAPFEMPKELRFYLCGHRGYPNDPPHNKNFIRLLDSKTGEELHRAYPPRSDTGHLVRWIDKVGRKVNLELVDGDTGSAFAWIGMARLNVDLEMFTKRKIISSLGPGGEKATGLFRSLAFDAPPKFAFTIMGYSGHPDNPPNSKNYFQLVDSSTDRVLKKTLPPQNDFGENIEWDLREFDGRSVRLEIVDGNTSGSFSWLAVGEFKPAALVPMPESNLQVIVKRQETIAILINDLNLNDALHAADYIAYNPVASIKARSFMAKALLANGSKLQLTKLSGLLLDSMEPESLRLDIATNGAHLSQIQDALLKAVGIAPAELQIKLARALAQTQSGAKRLFTAVQNSQAPPELLLDVHIRERFSKSQVVELTKNIIKPSEAVERIIADRIVDYRSKGGDAKKGKEVYATYCAACHKIGDIGGNIGPQLDGVSNRGLDRLIEDIIDPNRNIDLAFHYSVVQLKGGRVITGLKRRSVNESIVFAMIDGSETTVKKEDIKKQKKLPLSIMPSGFGQSIPLEKFRNLIEYLQAKQ